MKKADASDFRDMSTSLRRPFITISRNCKASGKGFEYYVKKYIKMAHKMTMGTLYPIQMWWAMDMPLFRRRVCWS
jgi:hypothetical protein